MEKAVVAADSDIGDETQVVLDSSLAAAVVAEIGTVVAQDGLNIAAAVAVVADTFAGEFAASFAAAVVVAACALAEIDWGCDDEVAGTDSIGIDFRTRLD